MCGGELTRVPITPAVKAVVTKAHSELSEQDGRREGSI